MNNFTFDGAWMPAEKIADACRFYIMDREKRISNERESLIKSVCISKPFPWSKQRTREEAIAHLKGYNNGFNWNAPVIKGKMDSDRVRSIGLLALKTKGSVFISAKTFSIIAAFYDKNNEQKDDAIKP